jgi:asparagine synthase (glutamine-hydrolysing)
MCGIAGLIFSKPTTIDRRALEALSGCLAHRGPDDQGCITLTTTGVQTHRAPPAGVDNALALFIHRRLSIIDLSEAGRQPMSTPDGRFHLMLNGEIYNYLELRAELQSLGRGFASSSDTEVLLQGFAQWGTAVFPRLVGMFAVALLDTRERTCLLVRDCFGIKPLYYSHRSGSLAFASEIPALLDLPVNIAPGRRADPKRLYYYLRYGLTDHGDRTMFAGIRQVPSGCYLRIPLDRPDQPEVFRYWQLDHSRRIDISIDEAARRLRELFLRSVELHMRSDVPIGAALSGGIDSSAIVCAMRQIRGASLDLHAVSYVADDPAVSEERFIDAAAASSGSIIHKTSPGAADLQSDLEALIAVQGEPFGSTSIYAQYRVFKAARAAGIKVMLDGQGADELLGGYRGYLAVRLASLIRKGRWLDAAQFRRSCRSLPDYDRRLLIRAVGMLLPAPLQLAMRGLVGEELTPTWLSASYFANRDVKPALLRRGSGSDKLRAELRNATFETSLPMLLRYEDRNSMAFSIESRVPFLTPELVEFILALPEHHLISPDGTSKHVFRRAMSGIVPDAILRRRDKIGFVTPERRWLTQLTPWVDSILSGETARQIPALDHAEIMRDWKTALADPSRFNFRIWRWINLIEWTRRLNVSFE